MRFGIPVSVSVSRLTHKYGMRENNLQDIFVQVDKIRLGEGKVVILQRFRQPEALHVICLLAVHITDIIDGCMGVFGASDSFDIREHTPSRVLKGLVACYAVHNKDRLDSFRSGLL